MAENYKHLYEQTKKMLTMYQDELIPGFRKQIEELEAKNKWIPVTERLPEENTAVIAVDDNGNVFECLYAYDGWDLWDDNTIIVTHWMPLPEPPKED
jgi:hypothetical protein